MIRTLIVDDEAPARRRLRTLLAEAPDIAIAGECADGPAAVELIEREKPDLVFLDIQMPEMDGLDVVRAIGAERMPALVFVTAHDSFALSAFELHAIDYVLKPFDAERFARTLEHARRVVADKAQGRFAERLAGFLDDHAALRARLERLVVREAGRVQLVRVDELDWMAAAGNYVELHSGGATHLLHDTLNGVAARLSERQFRRIHRSTVVNVERIKTIELGARGDGHVVLHDGTRLLFSRTHRHALGDLLGER